MPALDFPALPAVNQQFPVTPIAGLPQYTWDGEKWTTVGAQISNAVPASALPLMDATPAVVGVTTKYAREDHIHPTDTTRADVNAVLLKVPQGLSTTEQTDIRKNVYAAPFDALAYNGMQVNGSMEVSQERGLANPTSASGYILDGWRLSFTAPIVAPCQQAATTAISGLSNFLSMAITTPQASLAGTDQLLVYQPVEGYRAARLGLGKSGAQSITVGFWSGHFRTGIYSVALRAIGNTRSCVVPYTQNASSVWQYNTVTFPGDITGTWASDNTTGMTVNFTAAAGATLIAPAASTWYGVNYLGAPGQVNAAGAVSDVFRITGVVVLPGIEAPSAARSPLIMRPYDQELLTCRRYYQQYGGSFPYEILALGQAFSAAAANITLFLNPVMRSGPTLLSVVGSLAVLNANTAGIAMSGIGLNGSGPSSANMQVNVAAGLIAGNATALVTNNDLTARLKFDARL